MFRALPPAAIVLLALQFAAQSPARAHAAADDAFPFEINTSELENGLKVVTVKYPSPGIASYYTVVRTGSRNEVEPGKSGFAHFFEHMMFRGTERFSEDKYNDVLKALGADSNAFTNDDFTCYHMTVPSSAIAKIVELEADRFQNLLYEEPAFRKEALAVLGEYNKSASSPFLKLFETIQANAYGKHTYRHTTIGFLADVKDMPNQFAYGKVFFDRWYRPENCTIILAGDVEHAPLLGLIKKEYGSWRRGTAAVEIPREPEQTGEKTVELTWASPTLPILTLSFHIPAADPKNADWPALKVLGAAHFGETSELYQDLVLKSRTVESLIGEPEQKRDPGLFQTIAVCRDKADLPTVREKIERTLANAAAHPIDAARLAAVKSHIRYAFAGSIDRPDAAALAAAEAIGIGGGVEWINALYASIDRITPEDLMRVAKTYFTPSNRTVVTLVAEVK